MKNLFKLATLTSVMAFGAAAQAADSIGFVDPNFLMQNHPLMLEANAKVADEMKKNAPAFEAEEKAIADEDKALLAERQKLEEEAKKIPAEQSKIEAEMKKDIAQLEKDAPRLRAKEIQARQDKINAKMKPLQKKVEGLQKKEADLIQRAEKLQQKVVAFQQKVAEAQQKASAALPADLQQRVIEDINAKIKSVAEAKGYTVVLNPSVAFYAKNEKADITEEVLVAVGGKLPEAAKPAEAK